MSRRLLIAVACATSLVFVASASGRPATTNAPAIFTVKVTLTNKSIAMRPNHAVRGSTVTFILTNRGTKKQTFVLGDAKRGPGHGQGFAHTLAPNQQFTLVMYLDYRGLLKYSTRFTDGRPTGATGAFKIS